MSDAASEPPAAPNGALAAEAAAFVGESSDRLDAVQAALDALAEGRYGRCQVCGQAIEADRLAARASEDRCAAHSGAAESESRLF